MIKDKKYLGHIFALMPVIIYSFNTNFMKVLMPHHIEPFGLVLLRGLVSTVLFVIVAQFCKSSRKDSPTPKEILIMVVCGAVGIGGNLLFYLKGLEMSGPIHAMVIRALNPIIVIPLSIIAYKKKFGSITFVGVALALIGTIYITINPHEHGVQDSFLGDMYVFAGTIITSIYLVVINPLSKKYDGLTIMKWASLGALIVELPFGMKQLIHAPVFQEPFNWYVWGMISFCCILASFFAYLFTVKALKYISPFIESAYIYITPILGSAITFIMGLQVVTIHDLISFILILIGFVMLNYKKKIKPEIKNK